MHCLIQESGGLHPHDHKTRQLPPPHPSVYSVCHGSEHSKRATCVSMIALGHFLDTKGVYLIAKVLRGKEVGAEFSISFADDSAYCRRLK